MSHSTRLLLLAVLTATATTGCAGSDSGSGHDVQGSVTWKNEPLEQGMIYFVPSSGSGNGTSLAIEQGRFDSTGKTSKLKPGTYRIEITSTQKTGKMIPGAGPNGQVEEVVQVIPPSYNEKSKLTANVSDSQANQFQFDLTSRNR